MTTSETYQQAALLHMGSYFMQASLKAPAAIKGEFYARADVYLAAAKRPGRVRTFVLNLANSGTGKTPLFAAMVQRLAL